MHAYAKSWVPLLLSLRTFHFIHGLNSKTTWNQQNRQTVEETKVNTKLVRCRITSILQQTVLYKSPLPAKQRLQPFKNIEQNWKRTRPWPNEDPLVPLVTWVTHVRTKNQKHGIKKNMRAMLHMDGPKNASKTGPIDSTCQTLVEPGQLAQFELTILQSMVIL